MNKKDLPVPAEYQQSSQRLCTIWEGLVDRWEKAGFEIVNMVRILESNGYSRSKAIEKIILDHSHLKGFSRMTIYRKLPDEMKRKYFDTPTNMLPNNSDVSNDTFENLQEIDGKDAIFSTNGDVNNSNEHLDIKTLQERNQFLIKTLEKERYEAYKTRIEELKKRNKERLKKIEERNNVEIPDDAFAAIFIREYQSKDNCIIREYECEPVYKGWILPHLLILNLTERKVISAVVDHDKFELYNKVLINQNKIKK